MCNEKYIENLIKKIETFNKYLEIRAGIIPNDEFPFKTVENATGEELKKCKTLYNSANKIIDYYSYMKKSTDYINKLYEPTQYMLHLIGEKLNNYIEMFNTFADKTIKYNEILLDNNIKFNRALISSSLIYDDTPEQSDFIQKLCISIKQQPFTQEEKETINKFNEETLYVWKFVKLLD